ncbi:hypothetical protein BB558_004938 [Smittium angustum]|uniref:Uncharacterized protein n=1 Tax=Smittium angustum TaxID=133377 RepID=A0A2U1J1X5_SMIAN|nr:hypothetical protein BB558_004938 [Smittium angustum]
MKFFTVLLLTAGSSVAIRAVSKPEGSGITSRFSFFSPNGVTVASDGSNVNLDVKVSISGLTPNQNYTYHIHEAPVPADGNCTLTKLHFDPLKANKLDGKYVCNPKDITTCELGDMSGIYGKAIVSKAGEIYENKFSIPKLNLYPGNMFYVGDLSVVIHDGTSKRVACANINKLKKC